MKPLPLPNISPQPSTQNAMVEQANTMKFFDRMFVEFLTRQKPLSTHAKPRFMKKTSIAVTNTQIVSSATLTCGSMSASSFSCSRPVWGPPPPPAAGGGSAGGTVRSAAGQVTAVLEVVNQLRGDGALV